MEINEGSIVWTKLRGHPWWPAQVSSIPRKYKTTLIN